MTTRRIEWTTPKGTKVELALLTSEITDADGHKVETACYKLRCWVRAASRLLDSPKVITHPVAGLSLTDKETVVPITPEVANAVAALVAEFWTEKDRRLNEWIKGEREYEAHQATMRRAGFCDDPNAE